MKSTRLEIDFSPVNNVRLSNLCGILDENLKQIENALSVRISRRAALFTVYGESDEQVQKAEQALRYFYQRSRKELDPERIQLGLVELKFHKPTQSDVISVESLPEIRPEFAQEMAFSPTLILRTRRTDLGARTPRQQQYLHKIQTHDITFGIGPAGTGKTYLAVACAVDAFERDLVKRIVLVRPAVEAGERLGFLPGDLVQKVDPYLRPLYDALYDLMGSDKVSKMLEQGLIEIAPLAFMRGRTLNHSFIILDEAQNTTPEQMKMFLTRIGFGTKAVITGDATQIDLARHQKSGLIEAQTVLSKIKGIAFIEFQNEDVVRHPLVQKIVDAYQRYAEKTTH